MDRANTALRKGGQTQKDACVVSESMPTKFRNGQNQATLLSVVSTGVILVETAKF